MNKIQVEPLGIIQEISKVKYMFPTEKGSYKKALELSEADYLKQQNRPLKFKEDAFWAYKGYTFQVINGYDAKLDEEISYNVARKYVEFIKK